LRENFADGDCEKGGVHAVEQNLVYKMQKGGHAVAPGLNAGCVFRVDGKTRVSDRTYSASPVSKVDPLWLEVKVRVRVELTKVLLCVGRTIGVKEDEREDEIKKNGVQHEQIRKTKQDNATQSKTKTQQKRTQGNTYNHNDNHKHKTITTTIHPITFRPMLKPMLIECNPTKKPNSQHLSAK
jgi:hypothetical protein